MSIFDSELQTVIKELQNFGLTFDEISTRIDNRVSPRTLQRYKAGKAAKNKHVIKALKDLLIEVRVENGEL